MNSENLIHGMVPDNVRAAEDYNEEFSPKLSGEVLSEDYDLAVLGVPREKVFLDRLGFLLEDEEISGEVLSKPEYVQELAEDERLEISRDNIKEFSYDEEPSRRADLEAINQIHDGENDLVMATWSYNVPRTNYEASSALSLDGVSDSYHIEFPEFDSMEVSTGFMSMPWFKGALYTLADSVPETSSITSGIADGLPQHISSDGESFSYEVEETRRPSYFTIGVPWSDEIEEINKRHSMELFKNNVAPGWQKVKDGLKSTGRVLSDDFDY